MSKRRRFAAARTTCQSYEPRSVFVRNLFNDFFEQPDFARARYSCTWPDNRKSWRNNWHLVFDTLALATMLFIITRTQRLTATAFLRVVSLRAHLLDRWVQKSKNVG